MFGEHDSGYESGIEITGYEIIIKAHCSAHGDLKMSFGMRPERYSIDTENLKCFICKNNFSKIETEEITRKNK